MKVETILKAFTALVLAVTPAIAGTHGLNPLIRADIGFEFQVKECRFPAGRYTIARINQGMLSIRGVENKKAEFFVVHGGQRETNESKPHLVFHRFGNQHFLAQVWNGFGDASQDVFKSTAERKAQAKQRRNLARHSAEPETVTVFVEVGN